MFIDCLLDSKSGVNGHVYEDAGPQRCLNGDDAFIEVDRRWRRLRVPVTGPSGVLSIRSILKTRRFVDRLGGRFLRTTTDSDLPFLYIHFVLPYTVVTVLSRPRYDL